MNTTRGIRNNNPLNIRHSSNRWQGMTEKQTDPSFVQFRSMAYGYRAACKVLQTYYQRFRTEGKPFTVRTIISRWAPPEDNNDTESYIRSVLLIGGLGGQEILFPPDNPLGYERLERLLIAMTCVESGIGTNRVDNKMILEGYRMAFPSVQKVSECNKLADFG